MLVRRAFARRLFVCLLCVPGAWIAPGEAQAQQNEHGRPFRSSDYAIDFFQGPVLGGTRVTGLAGAYTALAMGAEGQAYNPAAPAVRTPWSSHRFDWDIDGGITFASLIRNTDFDNNGKSGFNYNSFFFGTAGGQVTLRHFGMGAQVNLQQYSLSSDGGRDRILRSAQLKVVGAYSFADDQLVLGAGFRVMGLYLVNAAQELLGQEQSLFDSVGIGGEVGALLTPKQTRLRLGATVRSPITTTASPGDGITIGNGATPNYRLGSAYLPARVHVPWEVELGAAYTIGPTPLNFPWLDRDTIPDQEARQLVMTEEVEPEDAKRVLAKRRYARLPRTGLLLTSSLVITGITPNGVGFESFLSQTLPGSPGLVERSGERISISPRFAIEVEPIPNRLQVRMGGYQEPSRFRDGKARMHGTLGFDLKLFESTVFGLYDKGTAFRIGAGGDLTERYFSWSISGGLWR
jgi:hypothetical protein